MFSTSVLILGFVVVYCIILFSVAFLTSRNADNESFFIGNKSSNWALVAFGMIGTSLSGMTFISVPGTVGTKSFAYFQVVIGYFLGYIVIAYVLLPLYYRLQLTSIYTYLTERFNDTAYKYGALIFIVSRTLGATLRLYLVIKVLQYFLLDDMGISFTLTSALVVGLIVLYTFKGGVKTIVWTDTLQTTFMLLALVVCIFYILNHLGLGITDAIPALSAEGYTTIFETDRQLPDYFIKSIIGGMLITITMTGMDQEMMQKNISVSTLKDSQKNMLTFSVILVIVNLMFLVLGGLLYLYAAKTGITATKDDLFPYFALKSGVPIGISIIFIIGLVSALFPSADGALTALTSSFCIDILGLDKADFPVAQKVRTRIFVHLTLAFIFFLLILYFKNHDDGMLIATLLTIAAYTYGPLLGMFSFGILTHRTPKTWAIPLAVFLSPLICFIINIASNGGYTNYPSIMSNAGLMNIIHWIELKLNGFQFGLEILLINGLITFLIFLLFSTKKNDLTTTR